MSRVKVIYEVGYPIFFYKRGGSGYWNDEVLDVALNGPNYERDLSGMDIFLTYLSKRGKAEIMLAFEYFFLCVIDGEFFARHELDFAIIETFTQDHLHPTLLTNTPKPTYTSEYIHTIGQLFLAGYVDFLCTCDDDYHRIDYPTNLSYYKEDKYQAWVYFRDNFFYANVLKKGLDEDILIYEGKEYSEKDCPRIEKDGGIHFLGYSTMYSDTSWDTPKYWSAYNILVVRTPKGDDYFNHILAPKFYEKYKDLEVEIDNQGNILGWYDGGVRVL
ncbi:hypothetical protein [Helicobacter cynogastricus]|uniref:hypothetical protein n=1 Tax=Helicobacter cynogastricus TaxID=329937 RepID=UPI000CF01764|nr:hypothetical protein [Helicobacter cynogastricus]